MMHYVVLKFVLDKVHFLRRLYENHYLLKIQIDLLVTYGFSIFSTSYCVEYIYEVFWFSFALSLLLGFLASKDKPILINFFTQPNPNKTIDFKFNEKKELTKCRIKYLSF